MGGDVELDAPCRPRRTLIGAVGRQPSALQIALVLGGQSESAISRKNGWQRHEAERPSSLAVDSTTDRMGGATARRRERRRGSRS